MPAGYRLLPVYPALNQCEQGAWVAIGTPNISEIMLRVVGAFYLFAGYAATRGWLT